MNMNKSLLCKDFFRCVTENPQLGRGVKDELKAMSKKKDSPYKGATARSTDIIRRIKMSEDSLAYKK